MQNDITFGTFLGFVDGIRALGAISVYRMTKIMQNDITFADFLGFVDGIRAFGTISVYRMTKIVQNDITFGTYLGFVDGIRILRLFLGFVDDCSSCKLKITVTKKTDKCFRAAMI